MGRRGARQQPLWIATDALPRSKGDPFYGRLNEVRGGGFDESVEECCELLRVNQGESSASIKVRVGDRAGGMVLGGEEDCKRG